MIDIGARIKHLRQINGLSQADLAERAGLTKGAISQIERNLASPAVANLLEILSALGETPSSFFAEDDEEKVLFRKRTFSSSSSAKKEEGVSPSAERISRRFATAGEARFRSICEVAPLGRPGRAARSAWER